MVLNKFSSLSVAACLMALLFNACAPEAEGDFVEEGDLKQSNVNNAPSCFKTQQLLLDHICNNHASRLNNSDVNANWSNGLRSHNHYHGFSAAHIKSYLMTHQATWYAASKNPSFQVRDVTAYNGTEESLSEIEVASRQSYCNFYFWKLEDAVNIDFTRVPSPNAVMMFEPICN